MSREHEESMDFIMNNVDIGEEFQCNAKTPCAFLNMVCAHSICVHIN